MKCVFMSLSLVAMALSSVSQARMYYSPDQGDTDSKSVVVRRIVTVPVVAPVATPAPKPVVKAVPAPAPKPVVKPVPVPAPVVKAPAPVVKPVPAPVVEAPAKVEKAVSTRRIRR